MYLCALPSEYLRVALRVHWYAPVHSIAPTRFERGDIALWLNSFATLHIVVPVHCKARYVRELMTLKTWLGGYKAFIPVARSIALVTQILKGSYTYADTRAHLAFR